MLQHQYRKTPQSPRERPRPTRSLQQFKTELALISQVTQKTANENVSPGIMIQLLVNQIAQSIR
jgi:hypothetical protein